MVNEIVIKTYLLQPKSRWDDEPKNEICKNREFGVATIVIIGNYEKP